MPRAPRSAPTRSTVFAVELLQVIESMMRRLFFLLAVVAAGPSMAQQLVSNAGVVSRVIFTDNLFSAPSNKDSAAILQLIPNISGVNSGRHSRYRYFYGPSVIIYGGGHSDLNRVSHILQGDATLSLIEDYLGMRVTARANQNLIDPAQLGTRSGFDSLGNPDAYAQTAAIEVAPVISLPLIRGDYATLQVEPGINYSFSSDTADGRRNLGQAGSRSYVRLTSGEYFSRMPWQLVWYGNALVNNANTNGTANNRYSELTFTANYRWDRELTIQGLAGYDNNSYGGLDETRAPRWRITPIWSPTSQTTIGLGYGHRYFGNDWYLRWEHRLKRTIFSLEYDSTVSDARTSILSQDVVSFQDPFGDAIDPVTGGDFTGSNTNPVLTAGTFVLNQLRGRFAWRRGRNYLSLDVWQDERDYEISDVSYLDTYSTLTLNRSMTQLARGSLRLDYWQHSDQSGSSPRAADFTQYRLSLSWEYDLSERLAADVTYSFINRASDFEDEDYDENRLYLTLNWRL